MIHEAGEKIPMRRIFVMAATALAVIEQLIKSDLDRWGNVIKSAGIRVE
jgi:hypothetical protein